MSKIGLQSLHKKGQPPTTNIAQYLYDMLSSLSITKIFSLTALMR